MPSLEQGAVVDLRTKLTLNNLESPGLFFYVGGTYLFRELVTLIDVQLGELHLLHPRKMICTQMSASDQPHQPDEGQISFEALNQYGKRAKKWTLSVEGRKTPLQLSQLTIARC